MSFELDIRSDASAAFGICKRRRLGKVRHLAVSDLWIQDHLRSGDPADALTKFVDRATLEKHTANMHRESIEGRAESAPRDG